MEERKKKMKELRKGKGKRREKNEA